MNMLASAFPFDAIPAPHLALMRLPEHHPEYSRRPVAAVPGVNPGNAHCLLKALLNKGRMKARNFQRSDNRLRYLYALPAPGVHRCMQLTRAFLAIEDHEYEVLNSRTLLLRQELFTESEGQL